MRRPQSSGARSFDYLIRAQQERWRDREAEGLRGLEVDDELEPRGLLDGQIRRLPFVTLHHLRRTVVQISR